MYSSFLKIISKLIFGITFGDLISELVLVDFVGFLLLLKTDFLLKVVL